MESGSKHRAQGLWLHCGKAQGAQDSVPRHSPSIKDPNIKQHKVSFVQKGVSDDIMVPGHAGLGFYNPDLRDGRWATRGWDSVMLTSEMVGGGRDSLCPTPRVS